MGYKIIVDSCGELPKRLKEDAHFQNVPLTLQVDEHQIIDDETFDQAKFLKLVADSPNCPKSSCPSPECYMDSYKGEAKNVYAVTLSEQLSGSYNSAVLGKNLYLEENRDKNIHVFNSKSASVGETLIALKIEECEKAGMEFQDTVNLVEKYIDEMNTFFVLENLDTLRKNGRLSNIKAFVASALKIKPVMGATPEGTIFQLDQARGMNKALVKMVEYVSEKTRNSEDKILGISHCNCAERAEMVKEELESRLKLKDIFIVDTAGVSSMYANDGGIIVTV